MNWCLTSPREGHRMLLECRGEVSVLYDDLRYDSTHQCCHQTRSSAFDESPGASEELCSRTSLMPSEADMAWNVFQCLCIPARAKQQRMRHLGVHKHDS